MIERNHSQKAFWPVFSIATVAVLLAAALRWSSFHPYGIHWDEAEYLDSVLIDAHRLMAGSLLKLGGRLLIKSAGIPPAYRILALPFLVVFGLHTTVARIESLAAFAMTALFIFWAVRRIANSAAGAFATLIFCLSPEVFSASIFYSTDVPLYLATAALIYYLLVYCGEDPQEQRAWLGMGLSIGLGLLAKASFIAIAIPAFLFVVVKLKMQGRKPAEFLPVIKAGALGLLIGAPWWVINFRAAASYAKYARDFARNSLGSPGPATWARWSESAFLGLLGPAVAIVLALVLAIYVAERFLGKAAPSSFQKTALGICACAGLPIVLEQLSGTNHLLRHVSPAMVPLSIVGGLLAYQAGFMLSTVGTVSCAALFLVQLVLIVSPVVRPNQDAVGPGMVNGSLPWRVLIRFDQWDWKPLQSVAEGCALSAPKIAYLGNGRAFNEPQIAFPWALSQSPETASSYPGVTWLWRFEDGPINWSKVMDAADQNDIALVAPDLAGEAMYKEDIDNQHNSEFERRLEHDPLFRNAGYLMTGRFQPVCVSLFVKKNLSCKTAPPNGGSPAALHLVGPAVSFGDISLPAGNIPKLSPSPAKGSN